MLYYAPDTHENSTRTKFPSRCRRHSACPGG